MSVEEVKVNHPEAKIYIGAGQVLAFGILASMLGVLFMLLGNGSWQAMVYPIAYSLSIVVIADKKFLRFYKERKDG